MDGCQDARGLNVTESLSKRLDTALARAGVRRALVAGEVNLTAAELRRRRQVLSAALHARGLAAGETVGVLVDRSAESLVAILAVLHAGCAYLPLDPTTPEVWQRRLLTLAHARILLHTEPTSVAAERLSDLLPGGCMPTTEMSAASPAEHSPADGQLAYVMGTSGTTGHPKAIPVSAAGLLHYCDAFAARVGGDSELTGTRMASVTTLAADLGNTMVFPSLLYGGELHIIPESIARDPQRFAGHIRSNGMDALKVVPTHLRALLDGGANELPRRLLVVGGEPFGLDLLERLEARRHTCRVFNHYGPTETTVGVAMHEVETTPGAAERLRAQGFRTVPVGTPLGATELRVVDERLKARAPGQVGELAITGPGLSSGYLGDPRRSMTRFTTTGWSRGRTVFRSGDIARVAADGLIELFGRTDEQLKIRGHRVEAAGVEEALRAHPGVHHVAVAGRNLGDLGDAVVAWVHADKDVDETALKRFARERLPSPMVPARIVLLAGLPRTMNGKVDHRALPVPQPPSDPPPAQLTNEEIVALAFAETLHMSVDEVRDDFFRLGGNSLAALRVIARLRNEHGLELTPEDFFADARPAALARATRPTGRPTSTPTPASVAPQVRALWTHLRLHPSDTAYEVPLRLRVRGPVDADRVRRAVIDLVTRHEPLRIRYLAHAAEPIIDPDHSRTLAFGGQGLDIERGPLLRAAVTRLGPAEHQLDIAVHHIAFDGTSRSVLVRELAALLSERPLPPAPAIRPRRAVPRRGPLGPGARARLGLSRGRPHEPATASCQNIALPAGLWALIEARAAEWGTTSFVLVAAAWAFVLHRQDDETAVTIGTPADLRESPADEATVGYDTNVVVLEVALQPDDTVRELVAQTHRAVGRALATRGTPYADLVAEQRAATGTPPTRTLLTVERLEQVTDGDVEVRQETVSEPRPMLGVDVCVLVADDAASLQVHHREDVCGSGRARSLGDQLEHVLRRITADPERPLSAIDLLPQAWAERVRRWSRGPTVPQLDRWGAEGFRDRAAEEPEVTALLWPGGSWTRAHLAEQIELACRVLVGQGLGPGHVVAVAVPPGPAAVIAWHAAQLVGAAVLALDPVWPKARREVAARLAGAAVEIVSSDGQDIVILGQAVTTPSHPRDLAYMVMTSGSTGAPKLVAIQRSALVNQQSWSAAEFPLTADDRVLAHTSPGFDVAAWELLGPLSWGATLVFPASGRRNDVPHLAEVIAGYGVTVAQTVPSLLQALLGQEALRGSRLRLLLCGGEAMPPSLPPAVAARLPGTVLANVYGPTETAIDATAHVVGDIGATGGRVPIGRPIGGTNAYVLDDRLRQVPPGVFGHLAVGGAAVGLGYAGDPVETETRFVPDPFVPVPGARMYLTGDRARWTEEGLLEFGGRRDEQVKVRGNRVELGEVEAALRALPMIADAVAHVLAAGTREARLIALVVPSTGHVPVIEDVHDHIARLLPPYLVPSSYGVVSSLPRLPNGKVARDALPLDVLEAPRPATGPRTPMERRVGRVWAELLGHETSGSALPFFASGGTSLLIPVLRLRLAQETGVTLSVPELFEHVTVRAQAAAIERRITGSGAVEVAGRGERRRSALGGVRRGRGRP